MDTRQCLPTEQDRRVCCVDTGILQKIRKPTKKQYQGKVDCQRQQKKGQVRYKSMVIKVYDKGQDWRRTKSFFDYLCSIEAVQYLLTGEKAAHIACLLIVPAVHCT